MSCFTNTVLPGCYNDGVGPPVSVGIHYINDNQGSPAMVVADVNGDLIPGADASNTTIGACALPPTDVEFELLCDVQTDGTSVKFARRKVTTFDAQGVPNVDVSDFELDYVTGYVVTGDVTACPTCAPLADRGLLTAWPSA